MSGKASFPDAVVETEATVAPSTEGVRARYEAPRIEKRRSVARVALMSPMAQMGVGLISMSGM